MGSGKKLPNKSKNKKALYEYLSKLSKDELIKILNIQKEKYMKQQIETALKNFKLNGFNSSLTQNINDRIFGKNRNLNDSNTKSEGTRQTDYKIKLNNDQIINSCNINSKTQNQSIIYSKKISYQQNNNPFTLIHKNNITVRNVPLRINKRLICDK